MEQQSFTACGLRPGEAYAAVVVVESSPADERLDGTGVIQSISFVVPLVPTNAFAEWPHLLRFNRTGGLLLAFRPALEGHVWTLLVESKWASIIRGNATALMAMPDIDGALIGGASLNPEQFVALASV
jgi:hypothetical protein